MTAVAPTSTGLSSHGRWATEPFVMGTPDDFRRLREWLIGVGFTGEGLSLAGGFKTIYEFPSLDRGRTVLLDPVDPLTVLARLFLDGTPLPWPVIDSVLGEGRARLEALGLLQPSVKDAALCVGTVALYPLEGLHMVSDRYGGLETIGGAPPADLVYSPLTAEAHRFVELMPRQACDDYLELCSGCGVAALAAGASFATRAWAADITERSTRFAVFAARLNGLSNVTPVQGDLYDAVKGQTFDLITAHPPYVASFGVDMIFRDGGEDGEQITRRIIEGLPEHLRPGGQFYCDCTMTDRTNARLEQRIREMLGPAQGEFDVLVGQADVTDPLQQYVPALAQGRSTPELFARRVDAFKRLGITAFVSAIILIQRRATVRPVVTRRRIVTGLTAAQDFQWLLDYQVRTAQWGEAQVDTLLDVAPRAVSGVEWRDRLVFEDGQWKLGLAQLATAWPFAMEADCPPWFAQLLSWCDGRTPARECLRRLREQGVIASDSPDRQFAQLIRQLADAAFLELPEFRLPGPRGESGAS